MKKTTKTKSSEITPENKPESRPESKYFNRELSWLAFNERVLEEAMNEAHPLLERVKFLSISASNLDEFYMVRVAGLRDQALQQSKTGIAERSLDGLTPREQLRKIQFRLARLMHNQHKNWILLKKELADNGIIVSKTSTLAKEELAWLEEYFTDNIFPVLTPIAIDPAHPFPFLPNLSLALVLNLRKLGNAREEAREMRAILLLPQKLDRFISLPARKGDPLKLLLLEDVVQLFITKLFPGYEILGSGLLRISRDSELEINDGAEDLVSTFESAVKRRKRGSVILLKVSASMPDDLRAFLIEEFRVRERETVSLSGILGLAGTMQLYDLKRPDLKFPAHRIRVPERIADYDGDSFAAIHAKDIIIHHPFESFDIVVQFLRQAAADPNVIAIKQTLYRTSNDSPIVKALIEAAEAGKSVTALVELKARFDEEANIRWARDLERAGAQVIFGLAKLKTHGKLSLVVRRVEEGLRSYVHFGTGNYHPHTAKFYTDLSFFTCDPALCRDASRLFNYVTGYATPEKFEKISVAPLTLRLNLMKLIRDEIHHARLGKPAALWVKCNALVDQEIIDLLYEASRAGVSIDMVIRGICCLRPGVKGLSENIRVKSVIGRFLEHSRIFCFGAGHGLPSPQAKVFISSADWMTRNLDWRVEVMVPIENPTVHEQVMGQIMMANLKDEKQSWQLNKEGEYKRVKSTAKSFCAHDFFMTNPSLSGRGTALHGKKSKDLHA